MQLSTNASLVAAVAVAFVLGLLHLGSGIVTERSPGSGRAVGSFAGGLAVAYVFLHLLPEIAEGNVSVGEALSDPVAPSPLLDLALFGVALIGFTTMYALEDVGRRQGSSTRTPGRGGGRSSALAYGAHLASFAFYNGLITYTLPLRFRTGVLFAVLFTVAMALHFVLTDRGLAEHYPDRFGRGGRVVLSAALLGGVALAAVAAPTQTLVVSVLTALLGGAILFNVFKEELPATGRSSMPWFTAGLSGYSALLLLVAVTGG